MKFTRCIRIEEPPFPSTLLAMTFIFVSVPVGYRNGVRFVQQWCTLIAL